jgi:hypothetical protein
MNHPGTRWSFDWYLTLDLALCYYNFCYCTDDVMHSSCYIWFARYWFVVFNAVFSNMSDTILKFAFLWFLLLNTRWSKVKDHTLNYVLTPYFDIWVLFKFETVYWLILPAYVVIQCSWSPFWWFTAWHINVCQSSSTWDHKTATFKNV